jgi:hypothetical protein
MPIFVLSGAYSRMPEDAVAIGGSRDVRFALNIAAMAPTPEQLATDTAWTQAFWSALMPHARGIGIGSYVNFMAEYDEERVKAAYGDAKYRRLAAIKAKYDPENVFRLNASIWPGRAG